MSYKVRTIVCIGCKEELTQRMPKSQKYCSLKCYNSQDSYLRKCGFTVLRFSDKDVYEKEDEVNDNIKRTVSQIA
jgi:hypothetical protein